MAILTGNMCVIGVVMIVFGVLEGFQAVPIDPAYISQSKVSDQEAEETIAGYEITNMVTVIFVNSCNGKQISLSIENIRRNCYNVQLSNVMQAIKTEPGGIKLSLFDKPGCEGNQIEYSSSSQENINIPFLPASFAIARR